LLFQLAPSVHRTGGIGSGLWPTPMAGDTIERTNEAYVARRASKGLPMTLAMKVARKELWPTPSASDNRDRGNMSSGAIKRRKEKGKQIMLSQSVSDQSGALNPEWVEWLMGFPVGYTNLESE